MEWRGAVEPVKVTSLPVGATNLLFNYAPTGMICMSPNKLIGNPAAGKSGRINSTNVRACALKVGKIGQYHWGLCGDLRRTGEGAPDGCGAAKNDAVAAGKLCEWVVGTGERGDVTSK